MRDTAAPNGSLRVAVGVGVVALVLIHVLATGALSLYVVSSVIDQYGLDSAGAIGFGPPMDIGWLILFGLIPTAPLAALEAWLIVSRRFRWLAGLGALLAAVVHGVLGAFPVGFRLSGSTGAVTRMEVSMTVANCTVLLTAHLLLVVLLCGWLVRRRGRP